MKKYKVALVYDRVNKWGGAERVLLTLHEMFPDAPLYTSVYNPETAKWAKVFPKVHTSFLQKIPFTKTRHEWLAALMPLAFESHDFSEYDLVISVTSEVAKNIVTGVKTKHVCYMLTPTRYLWSGYDEYFENKYLKFFARPIVSYLRKVDKIAAQRPDEIIAISTEVQRRIKKYYERDSQIIFPPHSASSSVRGTASSVPSKPKAKRENSFLLVSRLVPYKKVDLAIKVFNKLNLPLVVVGTGSEEKKLKKMANGNIKFAGHVSEKKLQNHYRNCSALVFPQKEDFGLTAVEALSYGKPVVAYKAGGALDIVQDGVNGVFFEKQNEHSLEEAIDRLFTISWHGDIIASTALPFREERFKKMFLKVIKNG